MPEIQPWHKTQLVDPDYVRVDLVKEGANSQAHIKLFKGKKGGAEMNLEDIIKGLKPEHQATVNTELETLRKAKETAEADLKKTKDELAAAQEIAKSADAKDQTEEEILKTIKDPAVRMLMETQIAKTKAAEEQVRKARDGQIEAEAIAKAKEVPGLGAEEATVSELYKKLKVADEALCEEVFGIFKAASALVNEGGVFTEIGKSSDGSAASSNEQDAWGKIEKAAEGIAKSKNVSKEVAISEVIRSNPELYDEYIKSQYA